MRLAVLPNSSLVLLESFQGFRVFCSSSLAIAELSAKTWPEALDCANRLHRIWPKVEDLREASRSEAFFLTICLTQTCNLRCQYCYLHGESVDWARLAVPVAKVDFGVFVENEIRAVISSRSAKVGLSFFGGEPLLDSGRVIQFTHFAKQLSGEHAVPLDIGITTNGTLLTHRFLEWCRREGVRVMLSLDSPPEVHDKYRSRGKPGSSFEEIRSRLQEFETDLVAVTTITRQTRSLREALESLLAIGFREVSFNLVHTRDAELSLREVDVQRLLSEWDIQQPWFRHHANRIGNIRQIQKLLFHRTPKTRPCSAGICSYAVGPDGKRYFCQSCVGNPSFELDSGTSPPAHTADLWRDWKLKRSACSECWARGLCGGDCWLVRRDYAESEQRLRCELIRGFIQLAISTFSPEVLQERQ